MTRLDVTGQVATAASAGLLVGWLISGGVYVIQIFPDVLVGLLWLGVAGAAAYWLYSRMTGEYADPIGDRLVNTRLGAWLVMVAVLLVILTAVNIATGISDDADLGVMLWGFAPI